LPRHLTLISIGILLCSSLSFSSDENNRLSFVIGSHDCINIKYQYYFQRTYIGVNSGFLNISRYLFNIPTFYFGYDLYRGKMTTISVELSGSYFIGTNEFKSSSTKVVRRDIAIIDFKPILTIGKKLFVPLGIGPMYWWYFYSGYLPDEIKEIDSTPGILVSIFVGLGWKF